MRSYGKILTAALVAAALIGGAWLSDVQAAGRRGDAEWLTSYAEATAQAKKTNRKILTNFSGSDWCGWCIRLKKEVFDKPEFKEWAAKNVVLLELDFPHGKPQTAAIKKQNKELMTKFGVGGFPTILFIDASGEAVGKTGYVQGGPEAWIKNAQKILDAAPAGKPAAKAAPESLEDAVAEATDSERPLLLAIYEGYSKPAKKKLDAILADGQIEPVTAGAVLAQVKLPAKGADRKVLGELAKKYGIKKAALQFALIDMKQGKLLYKSTPADLTAAKLAAKLTAQLPKAKYNGEWLEDFEQAKAIAAQTGRPMLLDFTGSDWCGWCIKLEKEIFSQDAFKDYAKANIVLVKLDFPHNNKPPQKIQDQNKALMAKYGVRGFPTLLILDSKGEKTGQMGYMPGGPEPFIKKLKEITG